MQGQEAAVSYTYKHIWNRWLYLNNEEDQKEHAKGAKRTNRLGGMQKHRDGQKITDFAEGENGKKKEVWKQ